MTERTIREFAKELAGTFYDMTRSAENCGEKIQVMRGERIFLQIDPKAFCKTFPTVKDYILGNRHGRVEHLANGAVRHVDDGKVHFDVPGWAHWYDMARSMLVEMLENPAVSEHEKEAIMAALWEDREQQLKQEARGIVPTHITQRHSLKPKE